MRSNTAAGQEAIARGTCDRCGTELESVAVYQRTDQGTEYIGDELACPYEGWLCYEGAGR